MMVRCSAALVFFCCWVVVCTETLGAAYQYHGPLMSRFYEPGFDVSPSRCDENGKETRLLVMVHSEFSHHDAREAARLTWATYGAMRNITVVFLLGRPSNNVVLEDVLAEARLFGDVALSRNTDSFDNLTLKDVAMAEWVSFNCPGAKYVVKVDDDVFLNFPRLLRLLELEVVKSASRMMFGRVVSDNPPVRDKDNKYYIPEDVYPGEKYPLYIQGGAFIFTGDLIKDLYPSALGMSFFKMQDLFFTAFLASKVQANITDVKGFIVEKWWGGREWSDRAYMCDLQKKVAVHPADYEAMFDMWYMAFNKDAKC